MKNWLDKYEEGGFLGTTNKPFNYNGAWGGTMQTGGSIPGATGFTYGRIGSTPSNGKYAKKTLPSAQNGQEISYYQNGLDWNPKMISKNGSEIIKLNQLTNWTNYNTPQPGGWMDKYSK